MSKKRHKHREEKCNCPNCRNRSYGNNPFGFNPAQLMSLLGGNADLGKIGNVLSTMKGDGFDLNNLNLGSLQNPLGGKKEEGSSIDINQLQNVLSKMDKGENSEDIEETVDSILDDDMDENIEMLKNVRNIVDSNKAIFLDKVINAYKNGDIK